MQFSRKAFRTKGGIDELKKRVEREKKEKNNKKER